MAFTAMDVKALREKTGVGMMECKKALTEADGDMDKAIDFLRERGLAAAEKKSARIAAEGVVYTYYDEAAKKAALKKAADIYGQIAEKFDYAAVYALFKQANFYHAINPDLKVGLALPYYKKLIDKIESQSEKSAGDLKKLGTAYQYLAVHYIQNDKVADAKQWAAKLLEVRPDDETAKQIMNLK